VSLLRVSMHFGEFKSHQIDCHLGYFVIAI
jgi:hypothetical protein